MKIGIYDSGIGGFGPLQYLSKELNNAEFYYYADDILGPYGCLDEAKITQRCHHVADHLLKKGIDLLFIACNTATAIAIDSTRESFDLKIVGIEPYLNALHKEQIGEQKVAAIMTEVMSKSERLKKLKNRVDPDNKIDIFAMPKLASLIEALYADPANTSLIADIKQELSPLHKSQYNHLILGCTHYPLINSLIEEYLNVKSLDPAEHVTRQIVNLIANDEQESLKPSTYFHFFRSSIDKWSTIPWAQLNKNLQSMQTS